MQKTCYQTKMLKFDSNVINLTNIVIIPVVDTPASAQKSFPRPLKLQSKNI